VRAGLLTAVIASEVEALSEDTNELIPPRFGDVLDAARVFRSIYKEAYEELPLVRFEPVSELDDDRLRATTNASGGW
jgi:hypothetical protein